MSDDFPSFPRITRLHRPVVLTEKIDGENALISVVEWKQKPTWACSDEAYVNHDGHHLVIRAGARNGWLSDRRDNSGFFAWARANAADLARLGPGNHYGEWWGSGIKRGYGLSNGDRRFSLFNATRWAEVRPECCGVVPVVACGDGSELNQLVTEALLDLAAFGSSAAPGYMRPEGVVIFHAASDTLYKVTLPDAPKGARAAKRVKPLYEYAGLTLVKGEPQNMLKPPGLARQVLEMAAA